MIVMKFGGTSTQDASAIANVVGIVKSRILQKPLVVISAIAQATNIFEKAGRLASEGLSKEAQIILRQLLDRHRTIIDERIKDPQHHAALVEAIASAWAELEELVRGVSILRELTPRTLDVFYCYGELLSSRIVAAALREEGIDTQWIDTKEFMVTDDAFNRAQPMMDIVEERLNAVALPLIQHGVVPVTQGFIGVSTTGRRTTMGRESSDYSAAVMGAVLKAVDIQIWTDVDGVLTADPCIVPSPMKVNVLSFEEAYELSFFGAKVLHPNTMLPAIEKNIPIHVFNSRYPKRSGTLVTNDSPASVPVVKSIAYRRGVVVLNIKPKKRFSQYIFWEHLYNILTKYDAHAILTATSEYNVALTLDARDNIDAIVHEMMTLGSVGVAENKGILCLVGSKIKDSPRLIGRLFTVLAQANIAMISFGASSSCISVVIDDTRILDAVMNTHEEFFTPKPDGEMFEILQHALISRECC